MPTLLQPAKKAAFSPNAITTDRYHSSLEHLTDELRRLDLLIQVRLYHEQPSQPSNLFEQLKGLVLSEAEISALLTNCSENPGNDPEYQALLSELAHLDAQIEVRRNNSIKHNIYLSLPHLASIFTLTPFEERVIILCLAPELNRKYEKLYAYLQDDVTRKKPSIDLALRLLCRPEEERFSFFWAFENRSTLARFLLQITDENPGIPGPYISRFLKLDDRIVSFLLGDNLVDYRLRDASSLLKTENTFSDSTISPARRFTQSFFQKKAKKQPNLVLLFYGPYGVGKKFQAQQICHDLNLQLLIVDLTKLLHSELSFEHSLEFIAREALLQQAAILLDGFQHLLAEEGKNQIKIRSVIEIIPQFAPITFILSDEIFQFAGLQQPINVVEFSFCIPAETERKTAWEQFSASYRLAPEVNLEELVNKFRFTSGQIKDVLNTAYYLSLQRKADEGFIQMADLYQACHQHSNQKLGSLARKIRTKYQWEDIILPENQKKQLVEICNQIRYRQIVYQEWGFHNKISLGKGLNIIFCGSPGTGKTMAAEILGNELNLEVYKIDLSQVVSKYIGETEKNLSKIFREAETSNAILFFDEADALFGKRSEVKDAHDRYANIEIGYLLQKMEEYSGMVILATNLQKNIDEAFLRRMQFVVEFPFPDIKQREEIWRRIFPSSAPLAVDLDYTFLAERLKITGGNIKNIALASAFFAAGDARRIGMKEIMLAVKREYQKIGKSFLKSDLDPYFDLIGDNG